MAKVIKSIRSEAYSTAPKFFKDAVDNNEIPNFWGGSSINLTDKGELYELAGESGDWCARQWIPDPSVEDKTNIYKMIIGATYSDKETGFGSILYKSKKELLDKILSGQVRWNSTSKRDAERIKAQKQYQDELKSKTKIQPKSSGEGIPFWVWMIVGIVIFVVIANLT